MNLKYRFKDFLIFIRKWHSKHTVANMNLPRQQLLFNPISNLLLKENHYNSFHINKCITHVAANCLYKHANKIISIQINKQI